MFTDLEKPHHLVFATSPLLTIAGVNRNNRETRKVQAWLQMAEAKDAQSDSAPPLVLEIPTIIFHGENDGPLLGNGHTSSSGDVRYHRDDFHETENHDFTGMNTDGTNVEMKFRKLNILGNHEGVRENYFKDNRSGEEDVILNESEQYEL